MAGISQHGGMASNPPLDLGHVADLPFQALLDTIKQELQLEVPASEDIAQVLDVGNSLGCVWW